MVFSSRRVSKSLVGASVLLSSSAVSSSFSPSSWTGQKTTPVSHVSSSNDSPLSMHSTAFLNSSGRSGLWNRKETGVAKRVAVLLRGGEISDDTASPEAPTVETVPIAPTLVSSSSSHMGPKSAPPGLLRRTIPMFPWHRLPDWLTYLRCMSIPLFVALFYLPTDFAARAPTLGTIFAFASLTDWFDGFLARRWDITSAFGAFLDPVADKLMVSTALVLLAGRHGLRVAVPSSIILARELSVSALREWMASQGKRDSVKVGMQGKVKTALTMLSLTLLLFTPESATVTSMGEWLKGGGGLGMEKLLAPSLMLLYGCAVVTVTSGSVYFRAAMPVLLGKE